MSSALKYLQSARAIRERCHTIYDHGIAGKLAHFAVKEDLIPKVAAYVVATTKERYPTLQIPFHSRYRHLEAGGEQRLSLIRTQLAGDHPERNRALFDLVFISVLLDAGAGAAWQYHDHRTGKNFKSSEGLGVASFDLFQKGLLSDDPKQHLRAIGGKLAKLSLPKLAEAFHVTKENPLLGMEGRLHLLQKLGAVLGPTGRPSDLIAVIKGRKPLPASELLEEIVTRYAAIWPTRYLIDGKPLGDVWKHSAISTHDASSGFVPFHKLSQWLTYSLIEPLAEGGIQVTDLDTLTGLPEYRNGGLFIDSGVLELRDQSALQQQHEPGSELIVEWRALTVVLLDKIAPAVRSILGVSSEEFPLARVLEGGTWAAGRKIARERRPDGSPPLQIVSDGTVF